MRTVGIGAILGDEVVVLTGLSAGERVAAAGAFKLRDAVLVAITGDRPIGRTDGEPIERAR